MSKQELASALTAIGAEERPFAAGFASWLIPFVPAKLNGAQIIVTSTDEPRIPADIMAERMAHLQSVARGESPAPGAIYAVERGEWLDGYTFVSKSTIGAAV